MKRKTKIVFIWPKGDYYKLSMDEIIDYPNVEYVNYIENVKNIKYFNAVFSSKINSKLKKNYFAEMYCKKFYSAPYEKQKNYIFIIHSMFYYRCAIKSKFLDYLRSHYLGCKIILYYMDTVDSYYKFFYKGEKIPHIDVFDRVFSYNKSDCEKYGFIYQESLYSVGFIEKFKTQKYNTDVFFIGANKGRLNRIYKMYDKLQEFGLKCTFYVTEVKDSEKRNDSDIIYNVYLDYLQILEIAGTSRAILELTQTNSYGFTFRDYEAIGLQKAIITDNKCMLNSKYSKCDRVISCDNLDERWIDKLKKNYFKDQYYYQQEASPILFLEKIKKYYDL